MPRFFVGSDQVTGGRVELTGEDAAHLARSLRARPGERVSVVDDHRGEHVVELDMVDPARVTGSIVLSRPAAGEPRLRILVLQAVAREGMDEAVDTLVQAGAAEIHPVVTERTVARPDPARAVARAERWQVIARNAAQLGFRAAVPRVAPIRPLREALLDLPPQCAIVVCDWTADAEPLSTLHPDSTLPLALVIGPEGGLTDAEVAHARARHAKVVHLGPRVLRARIAGSFAIAVLLAQSGDLETAPNP